MVQEIEMESKNLLTKIEYDKLLTFFDVTAKQAKQQVNHYFETTDFQLKENGAALRIREKNKQWTLTLKQPYQDGLLETHEHLTEEEAHYAIQDPRYLLHYTKVTAPMRALDINTDKLIYGGSLETQRIEVPYQQALVVIDYSIYNGCTDYELEIEADSKASSEFIMKQLTDNLEIAIKHTPNKIERFYQSLSK